MPAPDSFSDPSERMKALFDAAIRSPDISVTEKTLDTPSSFVPTPAVASAPVAAVPAAEPAVEPAPEPLPEAAPAAHIEQDAELSAMLEERDQKLKTRRGRAKMAANIALLTVIVAPSVAVMVNPTLRAKFDWFVANLGKGVDDVKSMANTKGSYDEALDKVALRGNQIDDATRAMGVDPTTVVPGEDPEMREEMRQLMGDDVEGFDDRRMSLEKMGVVAKAVTGMDDKDAPAEEAATE